MEYDSVYTETEKIYELEKALEREKELSRKRMLALESLTPGGSEFVGDIDACVEYVRSSRQNVIRSAARMKRTWNKRVQELESFVAELLGQQEEDVRDLRSQMYETMRNPLVGTAEALEQGLRRFFTHRCLPVNVEVIVLARGIRIRGFWRLLYERFIYWLCEKLGWERVYSTLPLIRIRKKDQG